MKRQLKAKTQPRRFYDLKIVETGATKGTRYLPVTKILPKNWRFVRVWLPKIEGNTAQIKVECLYKSEEGE